MLWQARQPGSQYHLNHSQNVDSIKQEEGHYFLPDSKFS